MPLIGRVKKAWNDTPIKWSPIPIGLGLAFITFLQYRKIREREADRDQNTSKAVIVGPWHVCFPAFGYGTTVKV